MVFEISLFETLRSIVVKFPTSGQQQDEQVRGHFDELLALGVQLALVDLDDLYQVVTEAGLCQHILHLIYNNITISHNLTTYNKIKPFGKTL